MAEMQIEAVLQVTDDEAQSLRRLGVSPSIVAEAVLAQQAEICDEIRADNDEQNGLAGRIGRCGLQLLHNREIDQSSLLRVGCEDLVCPRIIRTQGLQKIIRGGLQEIAFGMPPLERLEDF